MTCSFVQVHTVSTHGESDRRVSKRSSTGEGYVAYTPEFTTMVQAPLVSLRTSGAFDETNRAPGGEASGWTSGHRDGACGRRLEDFAPATARTAVRIRLPDMRPLAEPDTMTSSTATGGRRRLIAAGVIAGPLYVLTSLAEVVLTPGFDPTRHAWSQLALADQGWIHVLNLIATGTLLVVFAIGLSTVRPRSRAVPPLVAVFGLSMVVAGIFPVDPGNGFPAGSGDPDAPSPSALVHFGAGAVGFVAVAIGLVLVARRLTAHGSTGLARTARVVAPVFVLAFAFMASGVGGMAAGIVVFTISLIALFAAISAIALEFLKHPHRRL
ncbi:DUF998 domain-containing protein [Actinomadura viridis]|uniref:DUF998 domain-containing protein n=1 Tax=Actinomadura viridis TaxID=58110 RepID=A0A931DBB1_9ACTN|nr:DUF998 domain-containing protein [Actinomadura viridis]MBG6087025.1 hypothetical protein [Actinomadura viridis]